MNAQSNLFSNDCSLQLDIKRHYGGFVFVYVN